MSAGRGLCRKALVAGSLLLWTVLNVAAQNKAAEAPQPAATFKSRTQLVLIPTIVTDHSGKPVAGLKAGDFSVLEDGRERQLAVVEEIHASSAPVAAPQVGKGTYANHGGPQQARNIVLMVLDTVNTPISDQAYARQQMIKFLTKSVDRSALISLMMITQNGVKVIHNFTTDTSVLMAALRRLQSRQSAAEVIDAETQAAMDSADQAAVEQEENDLAGLAQAPDLSIARLQRRIAIQTTLDSLRMIGQAYAGIPGRKALIWASAGFPFGLDSFETAFSGRFDPQSETASDMAELYRSTWRALNEANVSLYPVDVRGLVSVSYDASLGAKRGQSLAQVMQQSNNAILRQSMKNNEQLATFRIFAERTGGRAFFSTNDLASSFRAAAVDSTSYYMLGYYINTGTTKPGWHSLQVKVNQKGARVRARNGFFTGEDVSPEKEAEQAIKTGLLSPLEYTGVPVIMRWTGWAPIKGSDKVRVEFLLLLPKGSFTIDGGDANHVRLQMISVAKRADGSAAAEVSETLNMHLAAQDLAQVTQKGMGYKKSFDVAPGEYTVRFLVRDDISGRMGSVEAPLKIELTPASASTAVPAGKDVAPVKAVPVGSGVK